MPQYSWIHQARIFPIVNCYFPKIPKFKVIWLGGGDVSVLSFSMIFSCHVLVYSYPTTTSENSPGLIVSSVKYVYRWCSYTYSITPSTIISQKIWRLYFVVSLILLVWFCIDGLAVDLEIFLDGIHLLIYCFEILTKIHYYKKAILLLEFKK